MTTNDIQSKIQDILLESLALNDKPEPERTLEDLGVDSLDHADLVIGIEDEFDLDIESEEYDTKVTGETTVAQLAAFVAEKMGVVG